MSAGMRLCINGLARYGGSSSRASNEAGRRKRKAPRRRYDAGAREQRFLRFEGHHWPPWFVPFVPGCILPFCCIVPLFERFMPALFGVEPVPVPAPPPVAVVPGVP